MDLTARLLRSLGAAGAVGEVGDPGEEAYIPTIMTETFALPQFAAGVKLWYDTDLYCRLLSHKSQP